MAPGNVEVMGLRFLLPGARGAGAASRPRRRGQARR